MNNKDDILTVGGLIEYLEKNFNTDDKLGFFDEGGAWCELVRIPNSLIGDWMFNYVGAKMEKELKHELREDCKKYVYESYRNVSDNDVVIY